MAAILEPLGLIGSVLAVVGAVTSAIAMVMRFVGLTGGGIAVWLVGTILSLAFAATGGWTPTLIALASLPVSATAAGLFGAAVAVARLVRRKGAIGLPIVARPDPLLRRRAGDVARS